MTRSFVNFYFFIFSSHLSFNLQITFALLVAYASGLATHYGGGGGFGGGYGGGYGGNYGYGGGLIAAPAVVKAVAAEPIYVSFQSLIKRFVILRSKPSI